MSNKQINSTAGAAINSFIEDAAKPFLAQHPAPSLAELERWRLAKTQWNQVRKLQTRLSGWQRKSKMVDGLTLYYLEGGDPRKPTVVLLHGFGSNKENWLLMSGFLKAKYHLVIPDLPGYGESEFNPHKDYRLSLQAERLSQLVSLITTRPVHLVGNSMGGATAAVWAAHFPQQVMTITLMNSAGLRGNKVTQFETLLVEGKNPLIPRSYKEVAALFKLATYQRPNLFSWVITPIIYRDFIHRSIVNHRLFSDAIVVDEGLISILEDIQQPTLIMWGAEDAILDVSCAEEIKTYLPEAEEVVFPKVGHLPMLEAPLKTANALKQFWKKNTISKP